MLNNLPKLDADPLWGLLHQYREDTRDNKIDLLVGVYKDESGDTPVMEVVQKAEQQLVDRCESKAYKQLSGNSKFNTQIAEFLLGKSHPKINAQYTIQTVGGSGALRVLADFISEVSGRVSVWNTTPGYINHQPIMEAAGLKVESFRWNAVNGELDIETCLHDLRDTKPGDIIILHGCCHNPSGIDPTPEQWQQLADFCKEKGIIPLIDMAYQGFGDNPEQDAIGLRLFAAQHEVVLVAASCSKNMSLYCERTGAAMVITSNPEQLPDVKTLLERITRANYSMPPEHGAAVASLVFDDAESWLQELADCQKRVSQIRQELDSTLNELNAPAALQVLSKQKGMFSLLPLTPKQVDELREKHAIYITSNARINVAGLQKRQIKPLVEALIQVY